MALINNRILTLERLVFIALFIVSIMMAGMLTYLPLKLQIVMVAAVPAFIMAITVLTNVYWGVYLYFLYEFLRPVDIIPALATLKLVMLIELLTLTSWIILLAREKRKIEWDNFKSLYVALVCLMGLTVFTAANNRLAFETTQAFVVNFVIFMISTNVVDSHGRLRKLIWLLLLVHLYHAYKGFYNFAVVGYSIGGERTTGLTGSGFIGDENDFAMALNVMIPFGFFYFMSARNRFKKYFSLFLILVFVLGVIASASRGGWVGLVATVFYCIYRSRRKFLGFGIAAVLAAAVIAFAPAGYWDQIRSIDDINQGTAQSRFNYWKAAVRMFLHSPLYGVGVSNGPIRMPEFVQGFGNNMTQWGRTFHGTLPQVLGELGGLGITLYLTMYFYILIMLNRIRKRAVLNNDREIEVDANGISGALISFLITATFLSAAYYPQIWTLYAFSIILRNVSRNRENQLLTADAGS